MIPFGDREIHRGLGAKWVLTLGFHDAKFKQSLILNDESNLGRIMNPSFHKNGCQMTANRQILKFE